MGCGSSNHCSSRGPFHHDTTVRTDSIQHRVRLHVRLVQYRDDQSPVLHGDPLQCCFQFIFWAHTLCGLTYSICTMLQAEESCGYVKRPQAGIDDDQNEKRGDDDERGGTVGDGAGEAHGSHRGAEEIGERHSDL
ncbi:hypothetical protein B296_00044629 [Ensete ventricosum]|uniref:Uncharacterized protein n=1 Tax=Ensete ventricosum TaxID=4639 RepID=A0A426XJE3_ENSVE|nr:hypothetical protein B296_00044629 [Ensete ventricosum]